MKTYLETKSTDVPWALTAPKHWQVTKFKFLLSEKKKTQNLNLPAGSISFGTVVEKDSEKLMEETLAAYQELLKGEFIINPLNLNFDLKSLRTALSDKNVVVSSGYIIAKSTGVADKEHLRWLLHQFDVSHMKTLGAGIRQTINFGDIANSKVLLPPFTEQLKIASFLNRETKRIDDLIDEKQSFIALLKEKRQSLITHFVTKGLDPNVPMKDSGVEWIGEVPEHWELRPVKYLCKFMGGGTPSKDELSYWNGDIPWVSPKDMKKFWISSSIDKITEQAIQQSSTNIVPEGAVLMVVRSGILQRMIPIGITTIEVSLNQDMKALSFSRPEIALFFAYFVQAGGFNLLLNWRKQGATVESLEHEYIARFPIPTPPADETKLICSELDKKISVLDALNAETKHSIELLKERRSALITAAVTGKIDVTELSNNKEAGI